MRKKSRRSIPFGSAVFAVVLLFMAPVVFALQLTNNTLEDGNSDSAADPGTGSLHVVYERAENIYYWTQAGDTPGGEELVAAGTGPAIAVDPDGVPHVVFIAGSTVSYTKRTEEGWEPPTAIHGGYYADIDVDPAGTVHIAYQGDTDGGGYQDIGYTNNASGAFEAPVVAIDSWYYYESGGRTGRYYSLPSIKADASGNYHIAAAFHAVDGAIGWTEHNYTVVYATNSGAPGAEGRYFGNNAGVTKTRNAIALTAGGYEIVYYLGGTAYRFPDTVLAAGSQPAISADADGNLHVAYVNAAGGIDYIMDSGAGFSSPLALFAGPSARNPAVVSGEGTAAVTYEAFDATPDYEVFLALTGPAAVVTPAAHDFGPVAAGSTSVPKVFTITSEGTEDITLSAIELSDEDSFLLDPSGCGELPATLPPGTSCTVQVTFAPQGSGVLLEELTIYLDGGEAFTVSLGGTGFYQYTLTANASGDGSGTVSSDAGGIHFDYPANTAETTAPLGDGSAVVLTATAAPGTTVSWDDCAAAGGAPSGNGTGVAICSFDPLDGDRTVTATFSLVRFSILGSVSGANGDLSCATPVAYGADSTCTIAPNEGYHLHSLLDNGQDVTGSAAGNIYTITAVSADHTVIAAFAVNVYAVAGSAPGGNGTVGCETPVNHGADSACTIAAAPGYRLAGLTDNGSDVLGSVPGNVYTLTGVSANHEVVGVFARLEADLSVSVSGAPNPVLAGGGLVYTISVQNAGPERADGVLLTDILPLGVQFVSASPSRGGCGESGGTVTCDLGNLAGAEGATVEIAVTAGAPGLVTNPVSVASASGDPNAADNAAAAETLIEAVDTTPEGFGFADRVDVALNTLVESDPIEVEGINSPASISVSGGEYAVNGGPYTSSAGTVAGGDSVRVRQTSSGDFATETQTTLTIGGVSGTFSVTTAAALRITAFHLPSDQYFTQGGGNQGQYGWTDTMPLVWDYDGDGQTDVSFYHIPTNQWFVKGHPGDNLGQFGWNGEESIPVPGDYDGDGRMDRAFYHAPSNRWFIEGREPIPFGWGGTDCIPLPGDYDGDGRTDLVLHHVPSNQWFMYGVGELGQYGWGGAESIPVPADYDGDGAVDIAFYHVPTNQWFLKGYPGDNLGQYGWGGLQSFPVPGDFYGDGKAERGFYRPDTNWWFVEGKPDFFWGWGGADFMPATSQTVVYNWFRFMLGRFQQ